MDGPVQPGQHEAAGGRVASDLFGEFPDFLLDPEVLHGLGHAGPVESPAPQVAATCAYVKFVLVYAGVIYAGAAALTRLARRAP